MILYWSVSSIQMYFHSIYVKLKVDYSTHDNMFTKFWQSKTWGLLRRLSTSLRWMEYLSHPSICTGDFSYFTRLWTNNLDKNKKIGQLFEEFPPKNALFLRIFQVTPCHSSINEIIGSSNYRAQHFLLVSFSAKRWKCLNTILSRLTFLIISFSFTLWHQNILLFLGHCFTVSVTTRVVNAMRLNDFDARSNLMQSSIFPKRIFLCSWSTVIIKRQLTENGSIYN